jgi:3-oxoacyl-[acyl-carrier protein] reductase
VTVPWPLADRVALVTGGARGIGRACATGLSAAGAAILVVDRLAQEAEAVVRTIVESGAKAHSLAADLSQTRHIAEIVEEAARVFGRIDILVNNAGISSEVPTETLTEEQWDRVMAINFKAVFFTTQAAVPWMIRGGGGAIVNISSLAARVGGLVTAPDYAASKAGVIGLTRTLARQYGSSGIRVNAVAPGPIVTEMTRHWSEEVRREFIARIPLGRLGTAEDVARVVVFLAGPESAYLTGVTIDVNGGLYMG